MRAAIPLHEREIRVLIERMFLGFPVGVRNKGAKVELYVEALSRIPLKHVKEAADYAVRGRVGDAQWLPTVGQMVLLAEDFRARELRANVRKPDDPYVFNSKEQRLSIIEGFQRLISDLKSGKPIEPKTVTEKVFRITREEI